MVKYISASLRWLRRWKGRSASAKLRAFRPRKKHIPCKREVLGATERRRENSEQWHVYVVIQGTEQDSVLGLTRQADLMQKVVCFRDITKRHSNVHQLFGTIYRVCTRGLRPDKDASQVHGIPADYQLQSRGRFPNV